MGKNLLIFIGGVDNDDYEGIHEMAEDGSTSRWSSTKTAKVGDQVYCREDHNRFGDLHSKNKYIMSLFFWLSFQPL